MFKYAVGDRIEKYIGIDEETRFDIDDEGATLLVFFNHPDKDETEQFKANKTFEIRFCQLRGIIMITSKIGNLNWMDIPYTPHLSVNLSKFPIINEGQGLALTVMLIDAFNGEIKSIRLIGLSTKFSRELIATSMEEKVKPFNFAEYNSSLDRIYAAYSTKEIVKMSKYYCKIH